MRMGWIGGHLGSGPHKLILAGRDSGTNGAGRLPRAAFAGGSWLKIATLLAVDAAALGVTRRSLICVVRPVSLNLPSRGVAERKQSGAKGPCALIGILLALSVVPRIQVRIRDRLRQFMPSHIGDRRKPL